MDVYVVEIIRYGSPDLGVQLFGVFDLPIDEILKRMRVYNEQRGGKYPAVYITKVSMNPSDLTGAERVEYGL